MTQLPRALDGTEISLLRSEPQHLRIYVTVHNPATVYSARLAAVPSSTDQVTSITYNSGSGTHTNILADQTLWVGTSAGAYDLGMCRIRNLSGIGATSGTFNIAEESEINWSASAYLTVKDEFSIWPKHIYMNGTTPYLDFDLAYTDENSLCDSVPVMGQHRIGWLTGPAVTLSFDASESWELNNTINAYAWTFTGAASTTGTATATPTATYNATGTYRVACTVTNDDGKSFTGYRYIFILHDEQQYGALIPSTEALQDVRIDSIEGDFETGGWSAQITCYGTANDALIRDRALVIIHTVDWYGDTGGSLGFNGGNENVLFIGWIAGETITHAPDDMYSAVTFRIEGPQYWLNRIPAFPVGLKDSTTSPSKWTRFLGLSPKAAVWHFLHWRTTITRCCDVFNTPNGYRAARIEAPGAQTLWEQLKSIEWTTVLARPCADRYARLHNQIEQQLLGTADRATVPECMTLAQQDISGEVEIERSIVDNASIVDVSGFSYDGTSGTPFFSLSPGHVFRRYGDAPEVVDRLVLYDQDTTNTLCGLYAGWRNNEYPRVAMLLASGNRFVDIAPYQYWLYSIAAADSPRDIAESFRLIPRRISYQFENVGGYLLPRVDFENENTTELAITGDAPEEIPTDPGIPVPVSPPIVPVPIAEGNATEIWLFTTTGVYWSGDVRTGGDLAWNKMAGSLPGAGTPSYGFVAANGSAIYLVYPQTANAGIYRCANPKVASPTWTDILVGQASGAYPYHLRDGNYDIGMQDSTFWAVARANGESTFFGYHFGAYSGVSWSWSAALWNADTNRWAYSWYNAKNYYLSGPGASLENDFWGIPSETIYSGPAGYYTNASRNTIHSFSSGSAVSFIRLVASPNTVYMYLPYSGTASTELTNWPLSSGAITGRACGSIQGNKVFLINTSGSGGNNGAMWIGDTSGVTLKSTWENCERIHDAAKTGGGTLWATLSTAAQSAEVVRASYDDGDNWTNRTGDFWSLTSGTQTFVGSGLVHA